MTKDKDIKTVVPALRFPEFRDAEGWNNVRLIDIADKKTKWHFTGGPFGSNLKASDYTHSGIRVIQLQNIGDGSFVDDYKIYTSLEKSDELLSCNIYPGDIIISKMGDPVGRACLIPENEDRYLMCSDGIRLVVDKYKNDKYFIFTIINDTKFRAKIERNSTGSTRKRIGLDTLRDLTLLIPNSRKEQQKIANCFGSLDDLISAVADKIEALKEHKKGLMQQLFPADGKTTPTLRFPEFQNAGEWRDTTLGEEVYYENGKAHENDIDEAGQYIVVNSKFISTDGEVIKYTDSPSCLADKGDILMVLSDVPNGRAISKCFIVDRDNKYTVNQRICKLKPKKAVGLLLYYIINRNPFLLAFDDGIKQTNLKKDDVLNCPFRVPKDPKEKQRIADCLLAVDELTSAEADKLNQLKAHKKGLMQQLFPSLNE